MPKVIDILEPAYVRDAVKILDNLSEDSFNNLHRFITESYLKEIEQTLDGEIPMEEAPFFQFVNRLYDKTKLNGCYFCDHDIDGNETPFDFPNTTKLCLNCMLKVANVLRAFDIDHRTLFKDMGKRDIQPVLFEEKK